MYSQLLVVALAWAVGVDAVAIDIDVGEDGLLMFKPNSITAAVGDTLNFHFYSQSGPHSVISSAFDTPCVPIAGAFFSGYVPGNDAGDVEFVVNVTSTDPIYFYCSLNRHCISGMVGAVNAPSASGATQYQAAARSASAVSDLPAATGGTIVTMSAGGGSSSTSSTSESRSESTTESNSSSVSTTSGSSAGTTTSSPSSSATAAPTTAAGTSSGGSSGGSGSSASASGSPSATAPATVSNGVATNGVTSVVLGLAVIIGGVVALMA